MISRRINDFGCAAPYFYVKNNSLFWAKQGKFTNNAKSNGTSYSQIEEKRTLILIHHDASKFNENAIAFECFR